MGANVGAIRNDAPLVSVIRCASFSMRRVIRALPREVHREVRQVQKERLLAVAFDKVDPVTSDKIGGVSFFPGEKMIMPPVFVS